MDYTSTIVNGTFVPGGPTSINISVSTEQDAIVEGNEMFSVDLALSDDVPGILLGPRSTAIATIQDDDGT